MLLSAMQAGWWLVAPIDSGPVGVPYIKNEACTAVPYPLAAEHYIARLRWPSSGPLRWIPHTRLEYDNTFYIFGHYDAASRV